MLSLKRELVRVPLSRWEMPRPPLFLAFSSQDFAIGNDSLIWKDLLGLCGRGKINHNVEFSRRPNWLHNYDHAPLSLALSHFLILNLSPPSRLSPPLPACKCGKQRNRSCRSIIMSPPRFQLVTHIGGCSLLQINDHSPPTNTKSRMNTKRQNNNCHNQPSFLAAVGLEEIISAIGLIVAKESRLPRNFM